METIHFKAQSQAQSQAQSLSRKEVTEDQMVNNYSVCTISHKAL